VGDQAPPQMKVGGLSPCGYPGSATYVTNCSGERSFSKLKMVEWTK